MIVNSEFACLLDLSQINTNIESARVEKGLLETNGETKSCFSSLVPRL